jgi:EAL domain-containing protein (putative c-di-GMP-specific phosphodiesterase class I)
MSQLRQGIVGDEMFLLFQPKIDLRDGTVSSVEALARWRHPELGLILPEEFIPVAERTGLIVPLTLWVLHRSLMQCLAWNQSGIDLRVAVNLSMWNLDAQELPDQIAGLLESVNISPHRLELEITESSVMNDPRRSLINLTRIKELGVRLSIDDFGAGYSSLAYLTKLPVKGLKIDKSFVQNMATERDNAVIVKSIVDLGHNLGLKVVAEGVETRETVEILRAFKCDEAQGYYFSRPIPGDKVPPWLRKTARLLAGQKPTKGGPTHANMEQPTQTQSAESSRAPVNYPREAALTFLDSEYDFSLKQR